MNTHVHFGHGITSPAGNCQPTPQLRCHICAVDWAFEALAGDASADPATPPRLVFHPASGIDEAAQTQAQVQAEVRTRILRAFAGRGLIDHQCPLSVCRPAPV